MPLLIGNEYLGGAWTMGVNWSGSATAFGIARPINFDRTEAGIRITDWLINNPMNLPGQVALSDDVEVTLDPTTTAVLFAITNDSSFLTKATQTTEFHVGYSADALSTSRGTLYLGAKARLYLMRLSRLSVRFGDITDSEELWDAIKHSSFKNSERVGVDVGALWVGENYQVGAQITNVNEPNFTFPGVNLAPYSDSELIDFLERDTIYRMDRQLKFEASLFSKNRRWSAHLGIDADSATDPLGDRFQWATASVGFTTDSSWIPSLRFGYRQNFTGTKLGYLGAGATLFKYINLDIASSFETVKISSTELPQGLMFSLGFQINW